MNLNELYEKLAEATKAHDLASIMQIGKQIQKHPDALEAVKAQSEQEKAEHAAAVARADGAFKLVSDALKASLLSPKLADAFKVLTEVYGDKTVQATVYLVDPSNTSVLPPKVRSGGGTTGKAGSPHGGQSARAVEKYGDRLHKAFLLVATLEEAAELEKVKSTDNASGGKAWTYQTKVCDAALAAGKLPIH